jgi:hypothetical protein
MCQPASTAPFNRGPRLRAKHLVEKSEIATRWSVVWHEAEQIAPLVACAPEIAKFRINNRSHIVNFGIFAFKLNAAESSRRASVSLPARSNAMPRSKCVS